MKAVTPIMRDDSVSSELHNGEQALSHLAMSISSSRLILVLLMNACIGYVVLKNSTLTLGLGNITGLMGRSLPAIIDYPRTAIGLLAVIAAAVTNPGIFTVQENRENEPEYLNRPGDIYDDETSELDSSDEYNDNDIYSLNGPYGNTRYLPPTPPRGLRHAQAPRPRPTAPLAPRSPRPSGGPTATPSGPRLRRPRHIPFRVHTPFSLLQPSTWRPKDDWTHCPPSYIPVRHSTWLCLRQTQSRFWAARRADLACIALWMWECIKFQRNVITALFVIDLVTAASWGQPMQYRWFPRNARQIRGLVWLDREVPGHAFVLDVFEFWKGWVVGLGKVFLWKLPKWVLGGLVSWLVPTVASVREEEVQEKNWTRTKKG